MAIVYLSLGSNLGDRLSYVQQAASILGTTNNIQIVSTSSFYETEPWQMDSPNWFVNAIVQISTSLSPEELLIVIQRIESQLGRESSGVRPYTDRTIDIDILFYDDKLINTDNLVIPHRYFHHRACMLVPMLEIAQDFVHPLFKKTISELYDELENPEQVLLYGTRNSMASVGIIGAGASGCLCAYFLSKLNFDITLFDYGAPLRTILPTGGGRCNLAHSEYDFKELAKNYPRGEKFLYSVFSKFSTGDTISLFEELGIETYIQDNGRIFPISNNAKQVRSTILSKLKKVNFINEEVNKITPIDNGYKVKTNKAEYYFSNVVIASGGGLKSKQINGLKHNIIPFTPALVGLNANITALSGVVLKNIYSHDCKIYDDLLFTHFGISGPLVYTISSIKTKKPFPYSLTFDLYTDKLDLQNLLNQNPHKEFKNILGMLFPHSFAEFIAGEFANTKGCKIDGKNRDFILSKIHNFKIDIYGFNKGEETVTAGGYDLKEINSKTMESKIYPNLYIIGEALDIDGFCGGFNLQNAWSTAFVAANTILNK